MRSERLIRVLVGMLIVSLFAGCAREAEWQTWTGDHGEEIRWSPAAPAIGDIVRVEASFPANRAPNNPSAAGKSPNDSLSLLGPDDEPIAPSSTEYSSGGAKNRWSFRVRQPGSWVWGVAGNGHTLWIVDSVAKDATELKKLNANYLWSGKGEPSP